MELLNLPGNIIETVVRMLVNQRKTEEIKIRRLNFVQCLEDVLNLRATCVRLLEIVNNTRLKFPCVVNFSWKDPELNFDLHCFINFMANDTNWRFETVRFRKTLFHVEETNSGLLSIMQKNASLFAKSVARLNFDLPLGSNSIVLNVLNLLDWLRRESLKAGGQISFCIKDPFFSNWEAVLLVDHLSIRGSLRRQFDIFIHLVGSQKFPNLSQLDLPDIIFPVAKLCLFRNLHALSICNLELPENEHIRKTCFL